MRRGVPAVLLVAVLGLLAACASGHSSSQGIRTGGSTGLFANGNLRCTATVAPSVQAGSPLHVTIRVKNVSSHTVNLPNPGGDLAYGAVVKAADGTTYDTRHIGGMGGLGPTEWPIAAGKTVRPEGGGGVLVRWKGPLRVTPMCNTTPLAPLRVAVRSPGPPPDDRAAIAAVVAASGHLLDHCRPAQLGMPVQGRIYPPSGNVAPMRATCAVRLRNEGQFVLARTVIVTPPGQRSGVTVTGPYLENFGGSKPTPPWEVLAWDSVVTRDGAKRVNEVSGFANGSHTTAFISSHTAPEWTLATGSGSHWKYNGRSGCGGFGTGGQMILQFITACHR